jgi:hypothetical protein
VKEPDRYLGMESALILVREKSPKKCKAFSVFKNMSFSGAVFFVHESEKLKKRRFFMGGKI